MPDANDANKVLDVVSRVLHPRVVTVLAALIPGFFFEACVVVANPQIADLLTRRASVLYRYTPVFLSLLFAFVLGSAFILWVELLQSTVRTIVRIWTWIVPWDNLVNRLLHYVNQRRVKQMAAQQQQQPPPQQPSPLPLHFRFALWLNRRQAMRNILHDQVVSAWTATARTLLKRYGLDYRERYDPWTEVLGHITLGELRGYTLGTTLHATGWAGLAAIYFAPALNAMPFKVLCVLFIFGGMLQALHLAEDSARSIRSWIIGLANTWEELKEAPPPPENKTESGTATNTPYE